MVKKIEIHLKEDPLSTLRIFILEKSLNKNELKKLDNIEFIHDKYNSLTFDQKNKLIEFTASQLQNKFTLEEPIYDQLFSFCLISSFEKEFQHNNKLIDLLLEEVSNMHFIEKICQTLFSIMDHEYDFSSNNSLIAAHSLALIIELGIKLDKFHLKNEFNSEHTQHVIKYITSNLLARSNVNNEEIRIGLVYYLTRIDTKPQLYLQKILSRFGESLLESVFNKYFMNPERNKTAFYFLKEHLTVFLGGSAFIAEMTQSVLQAQMLKNPDEFIKLLNQFLKSPLNDQDDYKNITIHVSFLLKKAFAINHAKLTTSLMDIILNHLESIKNHKKDIYLAAGDIIIDILISTRTKQSRQFISKISSLYNDILNDKKQQIKIKKTNVHPIKLNMDVKAKMNSSAPSVLDEILLLAS
ncbi:hypothetical protein [Fluviispira sanaruensis]|uniref:Thiaminase-2/PQQC domain-containing protein n=1 Tax=Fluviispira sanaruensis TaxID=2493639 RepID=A0A4P2VML9_FLUSA|nr:hypothetical protein [Fluviispira sanaruensis]BBH54028.1 hypothetical protein JCM31447_24850 [Fluviispira sanaruensis]